MVATILFLPGSIITLGAGALFGVWKGFLAAWIGANLGACAAQLLKWIGLGVTVAVTLFVTRLAQKSLKAMEGGAGFERDLVANGQTIGEGEHL